MVARRARLSSAASVSSFSAAGHARLLVDPHTIVSRSSVARRASTATPPHRPAWQLLVPLRAGAVVVLRAVALRAAHGDLRLWVRRHVFFVPIPLGIARGGWWRSVHTVRCGMTSGWPRWCAVSCARRTSLAAGRRLQLSTVHPPLAFACHECKTHMYSWQPHEKSACVLLYTSKHVISTCSNRRMYGMIPK